MEAAITGGLGIAAALALGLILWRETRRAGDAKLDAFRAETKAGRAVEDLEVEIARRTAADADAARLRAKLKEVETREVRNADDDSLAELSSRVSDADRDGAPSGDRPVLAGLDGYPGDPDVQG